MSVPRAYVNNALRYLYDTSPRQKTDCKCNFYPRDAMLARVFATATCPSVRPSVCPSHAGILCLGERKQDREMYTF